jgi:Subtilase family/PA domain
MPTRLRREPHLGLLTAAAALAAVVLIAAGQTSGTRTERAVAGSWAGLAGAPRPRVTVGQRAIVVLRTPALADRITEAGRPATGSQQRRWTAAALAAQRLLLSRLAVQGLPVEADFTFGRVLSGFSAALDPRAVAILERSPEVAGVYPVRAAYPAALSRREMDESELEESGSRLEIGIPGVDGRGVTVALLDTGVDDRQPYLRGRVREGIDVVDPRAEQQDDGALPVARPGDPARLERHGTELAGVIVGDGGPGGVDGVATGAWVLPIRVAGWQQDASGRWAVFGRTDQILAGLERAVDPNGDGAADDAARIAVIGLAETYAAFGEGPLARAADGALALDTLVVAPSGNDGLGSGRGGGPRIFGSVAGPGGAPAVLTVGAADLRRQTRTVRVSVRTGLRRPFAGVVPLGGSVPPGGLLELELAAPELSARRLDREAPSSAIESFFDENGYSLVAGKAALVPAGMSPRDAAENAARAGAAAVVLYGDGPLPSGVLGLDEEIAVPVVSIPRESAAETLAAIKQGAEAGVALGAAATGPNPGWRQVAPFSSSGLAFDGRVKPELVAPGVGIVTSEPGLTKEGSAPFGTVNGSSVSAAAVAGAAALLADARPSLDALALRSLLANTAVPLPGASLAAQGVGMLDIGGAAVTEVASSPVSLALGRAGEVGWQTARRLRLRNVSTRPISLELGVERIAEGAANVAFSIRPDRLRLRPGRGRTVELDALVSTEPAGRTPAEGAIVVRPETGRPIRIPWVVTFGPARVDLLGPVRLSARAFRASDTPSAILSLRAGRVLRGPGGDEIRPVARLEVDLFGGGRRLGLLARLRDLLPGRYAFGLTGRDPEGELLEPGRYRLRVSAWSTERKAPPSRATVVFRIRR